MTDRRFDARINSEHKTTAGDAYSREMDALLLEQPPVIEWRKNSKGVLVAVNVKDPHQEKPNKPDSPTSEMP